MSKFLCVWFKEADFSGVWKTKKLSLYAVLLRLNRWLDYHFLGVVFSNLNREQQKRIMSSVGCSINKQRGDRNGDREIG